MNADTMVTIPKSASTMVTFPTFDDSFEPIFLYVRVRHFLFLDCNSLGFLFQKWADWVLEFPGLAYIFLELVCLCF